MKKMYVGISILIACGCLHAADLSIPYVDHKGIAQSVSAVLTVPNVADNAKRPAIIVLHSQAGWKRGATQQYAELFSTYGALTLESKMFDDKPDTPMNYLAQLYAELDMLASRPDVDPSRIFVMGQSYGASLAIYAAAQWSAERFGKPGRHFAGHAALYPTCFFHEGIVKRDAKITARMKGFGFPEDFHDRWLDAPVQIYQGAEDRYEDDPKACEKFVQSIPDTKAQAHFKVTVWPGTTHGWDRQVTRSVSDPLGCRFKGCEVTFAYNAESDKQSKAELSAFFGLAQK